MIDDRLNLRLISRRDVRQNPARLFRHFVAAPGQQSLHEAQGAAVQNHLRLIIIPGDNIPDGAQSRALKLKKKTFET